VGFWGGLGGTRQHTNVAANFPPYIRKGMSDSYTDLSQALSRALAAERDSGHTADRVPAWTDFSSLANRHLDTAFALMLEQTRNLARGEEYALAEIVATKALSLQPDNAELIHLLAARYIDRGLNAQAIALLEDLRAQGNDQPITDRLLGQAAFRSGDTHRASAAFYRIAADARSHDWDSLKAAAEFFRFESARPSLRMLLTQMVSMRAGGRGGDRGGDPGAPNALAPDDPEVCLWWAEWLIDDLDHPEARVWLDRATGAAVPKSPLYWLIWRARFALDHPNDDAKYREATAGIFSVRAEESAAALEALVAAHPDFWEAHYFLGTCYRRMGRLADARGCFQRTLGFFDYPNAWLELGAVAGELGDPKAALEASLKANAHFNGNNHVALCNIAAAEMELKHYAEAQSWLAKAVEKKPESKAVKTLSAELARRMAKKPLLKRIFGGK
jgi:tetratricopeptide (TPR) repeat protein